MGVILGLIVAIILTILIWTRKWKKEMARRSSRMLQQRAMMKRLGQADYGENAARKQSGYGSMGTDLGSEMSVM